MFVRKSIKDFCICEGEGARNPREINTPNGVTEAKVDNAQTVARVGGGAEISVELDERVANLSKLKVTSH